MNKLRVMVFTQEENFFIPKNILKASKECDIIEIVDNQNKNSMENKLTDLLKWFGFWQCFKMGIKTIFRKLCGVADKISGYKLFNGECSVKAAAKKIGADFKVIEDVNAPDYVEHVKKLAPDLIISYSAPQVVKDILLNVPKYGILNVHGAILPHYRGLLPSFWYLYNDEKLGGATVHFMSKAIDDGNIFVQGTVDISDCKTMFELMKRTKQLGGDLMIDAINKVKNGDLESYPNRLEEGSYFTWPTIEQAKIFRKKGKRLV